VGKYTVIYVVKECGGGYDSLPSSTTTFTNMILISTRVAWIAQRQVPTVKGNVYLHCMLGSAFLIIVDSSLFRAALLVQIMLLRVGTE